MSSLLVPDARTKSGMPSAAVHAKLLTMVEASGRPSALAASAAVCVGRSPVETNLTVFSGGDMAARSGDSRDGVGTATTNNMADAKTVAAMYFRRRCGVVMKDAGGCVVVCACEWAAASQQAPCMRAGHVSSHSFHSCFLPSRFIWQSGGRNRDRRTHSTRSTDAGTRTSKRVEWAARVRRCATSIAPTLTPAACPRSLAPTAPSIASTSALPIFSTNRASATSSPLTERAARPSGSTSCGTMWWNRIDLGCAKPTLSAARPCANRQKRFSSATASAAGRPRAAHLCPQPCLLRRRRRRPHHRRGSRTRTRARASCAHRASSCTTSVWYVVGLHARSIRRL